MTGVVDEKTTITATPVIKQIINRLKLNSRSFWRAKRSARC
jgi:hypothetical protein